MVAVAKQVGPSRWRESFGRYYEDFQRSASEQMTFPSRLEAWIDTAFMRDIYLCAI
jgi:hypothetical protein